MKVRVALRVSIKLNLSCTVFVCIHANTFQLGRSYIHAWKTFSSKSLASLATHFTSSIDYYLCLFMLTQFQLSSCIHACTNKTHFLANLQVLINPSFACNNYRQHAAYILYYASKLMFNYSIPVSNDTLNLWMHFQGNMFI